LKELAGKASLSQILKAVKLFGQLDLGLDNYSTLPLELALVDAILPSAKEPPIAKAEPEARQPVKPAVIETPPPSPEKPAAKEERPRKTAVEQKLEPEPAPAIESTPAPEPEEEKGEPEPEPVPAPAATEVAAPIPAGTVGEEIENLRLNWLKFIRDAPSSLSRTPAAALLRSAKPKAIENNTVILSFKFPLHKENMEKTDNQQIAEQIISNFLGRACRVRCVYEPEANHLIEEALKIGAQIIESEEK